MRWGQGECVYQPNETRLSSVHCLLPLCMASPCPEVGGVGGKSPFEKQTPDVLRGSRWPLLAGSCGASRTVGDAVKPGDETTG